MLKKNSPKNTEQRLIHVCSGYTTHKYRNLAHVDNCSTKDLQSNCRPANTSMWKTRGLIQHNINVQVCKGKLTSQTLRITEL